MPTRIAMLSWESLYSIPVGGLAAHVSEQARALHLRGHEVHVFTRMGHGQDRYDCINGVHYHRCPFEPHADFLTYIHLMCDALFGRLKEAETFYGRPFDVVHAHDWLCTEALARAKNELGRPAVLTMHSTEYGRCGNRFGNGTSGRIRELEWEATYVADRVICVSRRLRDEVARLYSVPLDKMSVVYNGVDVHRFDLDVDVPAVRRQWAIGADDPCVAFVGRLAWQKGPDLLVEAIPGVLRHVPRAKFMFIGDGDMRSSLEGRAAAMGLFGSVRFLGARNGNELVGLFKSADVVCVPSRNEPFGIVVLEAWSASRPVVATGNGGPAEFVRDHDNGLLVHDERDSIGWGVGSALADLKNARAWGLSGRHDAETRFTWNQIASETEQTYRALR